MPSRRRVGAPPQRPSLREPARPVKPNIYNSTQCYHVSCKTLINTLKDPAVRCPNCNYEYCLKHRLREEHDCAKITPRGARQGVRRRAERDDQVHVCARARMGEKTAQATSGNLLPKPKPKPNSAAGRAVALNALKKAAKGDAGVPVDKRLYLACGWDGGHAGGGAAGGGFLFRFAVEGGPGAG
ncbi:hypothetical protein N7470_004684 [Penicillium chermesinum]|nr:hypothetical protein N7470_004684 [Penicillium chermesinum]